jgi:hypothetical protein
MNVAGDGVVTVRSACSVDETMMAQFLAGDADAGVGHVGEIR